MSVSQKHAEIQSITMKVGSEVISTSIASKALRGNAMTSMARMISARVSQTILLRDIGGVTKRERHCSQAA